MAEPAPQNPAVAKPSNLSPRRAELSRRMDHLPLNSRSREGLDMLGGYSEGALEDVVMMLEMYEMRARGATGEPQPTAISTQQPNEPHQTGYVHPQARQFAHAPYMQQPFVPQQPAAAPQASPQPAPAPEPSTAVQATPESAAAQDRPLGPLSIDGVDPELMELADLREFAKDLGIKYAASSNRQTLLGKIRQIKEERARAIAEADAAGEDAGD